MRYTQAMRWWGLTLVFCVACSNGNTLLVDLRTDFVPGVELGEIIVTLEAGTEDRSQARVATSGDDFISGERVANFDVSTGRHELITRMFATDGRQLGQRRVIVQVKGDTATTVVFSRSCETVLCPQSGNPEATECEGGRCVEPECTPETPEDCPPPLCMEDGDCLMGAACARASCVEASCFLAPVVGRCEAGEVCIPDEGCEPFRTDGGTDAGALDAMLDVGVDVRATDACAVETCDNVDEDCDGSIDEDLAQACTNACGSPGVEVCTRGSFGDCDAPPEPPEICNGLDDDCDGDTDEGLSDTEACNAVDDDCDGTIDEGVCTPCTRREDPIDPTHVYLFCDGVPQSRSLAEADCAAVGYHLANVETAEEHAFVWMNARLVDEDHWWIGLFDTDPSSTDDWQWTDGSDAYPTNPDAYDGWAASSPGDGHQCVGMSWDRDVDGAPFVGGAWVTRPCTRDEWFVCETGD